MGLFDMFKSNSIQKQTAALYENNAVIPDFGAPQVSPRTPAQILAYLSKHPGWRQLPPDVLKELSARVADRSCKWTAIDVDHALEILILMTVKSNALNTNFIPICRADKPPADTPEWRLSMFAMKFELLASKILQQISEFAENHTPDDVADALEDAKAYAEASLTCDRYYITSFMPLAWGWVLKNGDIEKAVSILDEGIHWARNMGTARPHKASKFDEQTIINQSEQVEAIEETKRIILKMR